MKSIVWFLLLTSILFGCSNQSSKVENSKALEIETIADTVRFQIAGFPVIVDTTQFIANLISVYNLEVELDPNRINSDAITVYKKVKIHGSTADYLLIEYDYKNGSTAAFPWKYQLLLNSAGKLVHTFNALRFEFLSVFPNQNPFLLTVTATGKGNGKHQLYKMRNNELVNVLDENLEAHLQTYDAHEDDRINEPSELSIHIQDDNTDGFNDLFFRGNVVFTQGMTKNGHWFDSEIINGKQVDYSAQNPFKKIPVEYIFLYDQQSGHFKVKENYKEKYNLQD
ncbi:MAG: hypothetical protein PHQ74_08670 [Crocinitomicaceae bacterium]|nr:hypothetical protein [Crocinitomicaceae bacterium]